jgi:PTS system nitrogen regulatory IIA component
MSQEDFDLAGMAKYLHITPQQVEKLAEREKIPGRKIKGQWRFSSNEIHHWMEERMGLLDEGELYRVEGALSEESLEVEDSDDSLLPLTRMLSTESIAIPLVAKTKRSVIEEMVDLAMQTGMLWDPDRMRDAVHAREQLKSTALPNGLALLHPRRPLSNILGEPVLSLGVSPQGIPFGGSRGLTHVFFLICSTDDRGHLHTLARLTRMIQAEPLVLQLMDAADAREAKQIFDQTEAELKE